MNTAENNIEKIQESMHRLDDSVSSLKVSSAVQSEQISGIKDTLNLINSNMTQMQSTMLQMQNTMSQMQTTLAVNTKSLEEHMRRTELLENRIEPLEKMYWKLIGAATVISVLAGVISAIVMKHI